MNKYIQYPRVAGNASRQAHADLPKGSFEREMSKEGFYGPASFFYHRHPPTGWSGFEGPLRPHAFDLTKLGRSPDTPWQAPVILSNAHCQLRYWEPAASMDHLVRNADGDQLLFVHHGTGQLYCDFGHLEFAAGDYLLLPRGTMWRLECPDGAAVLLIEATNSSYLLPEKGLLGPHA
ncbi:MAG TPA: homogentisate 1,2-dioxygenase, partial [Steroidobacteraceae bacterium]